MIAHRLGEMEKRRVGTRFMDREVTEEDQAKPLIEGNGFLITLRAQLGFIPNRPESVFWSELPGTHRYTPDSF